MELKNIKEIRFINSVYFILLNILSIYFGKYRCVFFDGADWIYEIIAHKNNYFPHFRFAVAINGILPWIVCHFTTSMNYIVWSFIINYMLIPVLLFLYLRYFIKDEKLVLLFLISTSLFYTTTFFHPNHDIFCGYFYIIILYSILQNREKFKRYFSALCITLIFLIAFTNIIQLLSFMLILIYLKIRTEKSDKFNLLFASAIVFAFLKTVVFSSGYEKGVMSNVLDFKSRFSAIFTSSLFSSYLDSLFNINIAATFVFLITIYAVIKAKQPILILLVISEFLGIVLFTSFFFGYYPYCFGTEGYIKTASVLISIVFIDYYILRDSYAANKRTMAVAIIYTTTFFFIIINGINYKRYYTNINNIARTLNQNTVFISDSIYKGEHFYILPRESAIINLLENNRCYFFAYSKDSASWKNQTFPTDLHETAFCFRQGYIFKQADDNIKQTLNSEYNLIFELTNSKRWNNTPYIKQDK